MIKLLILGGLKNLSIADSFFITTPAGGYFISPRGVPTQKNARTPLLRCVLHHGVAFLKLMNPEKMETLTASIQQVIINLKKLSINFRPHSYTATPEVQGEGLEGGIFFGEVAA